MLIAASRGMNLIENWAINVAILAGKPLPTFCRNWNYE